MELWEVNQNKLEMKGGITITKNDNIGVKVNGQVKEAVRKIAEEENTSLSSFVEQLVVQELRRRSVSIPVTMDILKLSA